MTSELKLGNNIDVYPNVSGGFSVTGTDANGCKGNSYVSIFVQECLGLNERSGVTFNIFPNPASEAISISAGSVMSLIEIADLSGRLVISRNVNDSEVSISVGDITPGVYLVKVTDGNGTSNKRIIIE